MGREYAGEGEHFLHIFINSQKMKSRSRYMIMEASYFRASYYVKEDLPSRIHIYA